MHIAIEQRVRLQEALHPGDRPELPIMAFEVEATEGVEAAAEALRDRMRLGRDPIACVLAALEAQGVHVLQWRAADGFEGLSALVRDNHGRNIGAGIAVRADIDGESQRFTAAHEAGHLFLKIAPHLKVEGVCDRFARALLVPAETLREEVGPIRTRILLPELLLLKGRFGIGVPALIVRLFETGIIRRHYARQMFEAIERHGWRVQAPDPLPAERPIRFLQSVQRAEAEKLITPREAAELLNEAEGIAPLEARPDFMSEAGQRATDMARAELRAKGIAPVIWRDGETVEEGE